MNMVDIGIRDVPQGLRDAFAAEANARGQSLNAFLLTLMAEEAQRYRTGAKRERRDRGGDQ